MGAKGTVLVVDDQTDSLDALETALRPLGYEVLLATNGAIALSIAATKQPDIVLLDVSMPEMDGYEVCRRLKLSDETRLIPVVFLTGLDSRAARLRGLELGATDFLTKPLDLVELEVRVRNLVNFRHLTQDLDDAEKILLTVARTVEARDVETGEHCERLSNLAAQLGARLGLDEAKIKALRRAGYLHDIGKIAIPDAILLKKGALSAEEWAIMRSHVEIGVKICAPLRTLRTVLPIIRHHHEKWDGSGYPDGLKGEEIPLLARVFQLADVFDALTNPRPYRQPLSPFQALELMRQETHRGWWDTRIFEEFAHLVEEQAGGPRLDLAASPS